MTKTKLKEVYKVNYKEYLELEDKLRHITWDYESIEKELEKTKKQLEDIKRENHRYEASRDKEMEMLHYAIREMTLRLDVLTMTPEQLKTLREVKKSEREPDYKYHIANTGDEIQF